MSLEDELKEPIGDPCEVRFRNWEKSPALDKMLWTKLDLLRDCEKVNDTTDRWTLHVAQSFYGLCYFAHQKRDFLLTPYLRRFLNQEEAKGLLQDVYKGK